MLDSWIAEKIGAPLTREALETYQLARLNETLSLARSRSRFYASRLPARTLSCLNELGSLPFTSPADLAGEGFSMLCVSPDEISRVVTLTTSGSTGTPKRVYFTAEDQELTVDFFHHGMATLLPPEARVLLLFPGESPGSLNNLLSQGLHRAGATPTAFGFPTPQRLDDLLDAMNQIAPHYLIGPPEQIAAAARLSQSQGRKDVVSRSLTGVLLSAAYVSPEARRSIEDCWGCRVDEHYGMTEMGLGGAVSCPGGTGYHLREADLYFEIIDPHTGLPVPDGVRGELVFTTLTRVGMPLIRYRTGDFSRFLPPCSCGSLLRWIDRVESRPQPKKFDRPEIRF